MVYFILLLVFGLYIMDKWMYRAEAEIPGTHRHKWAQIGKLGSAGYCNICKSSSSGDVFCESCGLVSHDSINCLTKSDRRFRCKEVWLRRGTTLQHLWVRGNLSPDMMCLICCGKIANSIYVSINTRRCAWCQRCYHDSCYEKNIMDAACDLGEFKDMIIPPNCMVKIRRRSMMKETLVRVAAPNVENWAPLVVIGNAKSGSSTAANIISLLCGFLHPMQVLTLTENGPKTIIEVVRKISPNRCRILIAGGDGTIGWVLSTIRELNVTPVPSVAIVPVGTGNDLSRVLGWGAETPSNLDALQILRQIKSAQPVSLDRFDVQIGKIRPTLREPPRMLHFYCHLSVGVDARVTYKFHRMRESAAYLVRSRVLNKMIYLYYGAQEVLQCDTMGLVNKVELHMDDRLVNLPPLQSIVFSSADSWGAGCKLCTLYNAAAGQYIVNNSFSDGILEVFGIVSSIHLGQLMVGKSRPVVIGQARKVKLRIIAPCHLQIDGEPWMQSPTTLIVKSRSKVEMLKTNTDG